MAAHACVLKNVHWCTTICIAFIVPLASDPNTHAVCTINVGDSYAFLARRLKEDNSQANCQGDVENREQFLVEVNTPNCTYFQTFFINYDSPAQLLLAFARFLNSERSYGDLFFKH